MMKNLLFKSHDKKAYITLNRPHVKNALNKNLIEEFTKLLKKINKDDSIHALCLSGANHFFCAGADLQEMKESIHFSRKKNLQHAKLLSDLLHTLYTLDKPILAIIEGGAYGGGLGVMACCDVVIASDKTHFCFSEAKLGLVPALISPYIIRTIGERNAKRFFLTAEVFTAQTAEHIGLIHEIVSDNQLWKRAEYFLNLLCQNSLPALSVIKKFFPPIKTKEQEKLINLLAKIRTSADAQQRLHRFLNLKRNIKRSE